MRSAAVLLLAAQVGAGAGSAPPGTVLGLPVGLVAGAGSKVLRDVLIHPIETVKNRRQLETARRADTDGAKRRGPMFANLYSGLGPSLVVGVPAGALYLYIADVLQSQHVNSGVSGAVASFVFWTVRTPGEVVKTRLQVADGGTAASFADTLERMRREEGLGALYSGYWQTLCRSIPFDFLRFLLFDVLHNHELLAASAWADTACGFVASGVAALATQPLDVAKTLEQACAHADSGTSRVRELLRRTTAQNVVQLWWAGSTERVVLAALSGAVYFGAYEALKRTLETLAASAY
ncbi:hypothetical protein KFE25_003994 [Diacronema lutheri]|uniref:Uncharacterized protein n=1 Tax=Diacronema lutheri TaxID=2081491 RepID=A0A8J5X8Q3_DIALT|nr:hypothetical protein KFE25_003994 [Diacronema lutheri]